MKSIKFIFVMAALAAALAFVSCSNEAQDVNVSYKPTITGYEHAGFATGAVAFSQTNTSTLFVYSAAPLASVTYTDGNEGDGMKWKSDVKEYKLTIPVKEAYTGGNSSDINKPSFYLKKIGDAYYCDGEKIVVSGSPEDDEFTLTGVMKTGNYIFSTITFKRAK